MLTIALVLAQLQLGAPSARIGSVDDDQQALHRVNRVVEDPAGGRVFVFQQGSGEVAVFDAIGTRVGTVGRRGGGPGEFAAPANLGFAGAEFWVTDLSLRKFSYFDRQSLEHRRDLVLPTTDNRTTPFTISRDRTVVTERTTDRWLWRQGDRPLASYAAELDVGGFSYGGRNITFRQPFSSSPRLLPTLDGQNLIVLTVDEPRLRVTRLTLDGDTILDRQLPVEATQVTGEIVDGWVEDFARRLSVPASRSTVERLLHENVVRPATTHGVHSVVIGVDDVLWVGSTLGGSNIWRAIDTMNGTLLGTLRLPEGQSVKSGGRSHVWILSRDELDIEYLTRYLVR
jgi:hypothetical protein